MPPKLSIEDNGTKFRGKRKSPEHTEGPRLQIQQEKPRTNSQGVPHNQGHQKGTNIEPKTKKIRTHFRNVAPKTPPKSRNMTCKQMERIMQRAKCQGGKSEKLDLMKQEVEPNIHSETQISSISMPNQVKSPGRLAQILVSKGANGVKPSDKSFGDLGKVEVI